MNKKKTLITVTIYLVCLLAVIGIFTFYNANQVNKSLVKCYITTTDVEAGTVIDSNVISTSFRLEDVHLSDKERTESYGGQLITTSSYMMKKQAVSYIPAGTVLTTKMINDVKVEEGVPGYTNPQFITMPVSTIGMPAVGFAKDANFSIIGSMSLSDLAQSEDYQNIGSETWVGVLTNKAKVYTTVTDDADKITHVILIVEANVLPKLIVASEKATLYYLEGTINNISEVQSDIIKSIYESAGLTTTQPFELTLTDGNRKTYDLEVLKSVKDTPEYIEILDLGQNNPLKITWTGSPVNAYVRHYNLDGTKGSFYGSYSYAASDANKKINYDSNYEEHSFATQFYSTDDKSMSSEGYYEIEFYNQDKSFVGKTCFIVETTSRQWIYNENNGIKVAINESESNSIMFVTPGDFETSYFRTKEYFSKIPALSNYFETVSFTDSNIFQTNFVVDNDKLLGKLAGKDISGINFSIMVDGQTVSIPLYYRVDSSKIDYQITATQTQTLRKILNSTISDTQLIEKGYTYNSLQALLNTLNALMEDNPNIFYYENNGDLEYTDISKIARYLICKEAMSKEEFMEMFGLMYQINQDGSVEKNEGYGFSLSLILEDNSSQSINLDFIPTFSLATGEADAE